MVKILLIIKYISKLNEFSIDLSTLQFGSDYVQSPLGYYFAVHELFQFYNYPLLLLRLSGRFHIQCSQSASSVDILWKQISWIRFIWKFLNYCKAFIDMDAFSGWRWPPTTPGH